MTALEKQTKLHEKGGANRAASIRRGAQAMEAQWKGLGGASVDGLAKGNLATYRQDIPRPVQPELDSNSPFCPELMLALGMWVEELGEAFSMPLEKLMHFAHNLTGYRNAFEDKGNVAKVLQTLVDAQTRFQRIVKWLGAQGFGKTGSDLQRLDKKRPGKNEEQGAPAYRFWKDVIGRTALDDKIEEQGDPAGSISDESDPPLARFWKAVIGRTVFDDSKVLQILKHWEGQWAPESQTRPWFEVLRAKRWQQLEKCSARIRAQSSAFNWSHEYEEEVLRWDRERISREREKELAARPTPAWEFLKRKRQDAVSGASRTASVPAASKKPAIRVKGVTVSSTTKRELKSPSKLSVGVENDHKVQLLEAQQKLKQQAAELTNLRARLHATATAVTTLSKQLVDAREAAAAEVLELKNQKIEIETTLAVERQKFQSDKAQIQAAAIQEVEAVISAVVAATQQFEAGRAQTQAKSKAMLSKGKGGGS